MPRTVDFDPGRPQPAKSGPRTIAQPPRKSGPVQDFFKNIPGGTLEGMQGLADMVWQASPAAQAQAMLGQSVRIADFLKGKKPGAEQRLPSPVGMATASLVKKDNPITRQPTNVAGRAGRALGQNLPALVAPGSAPARVANTLLPAIGAQGAEEGARALRLDEAWQERAKMLGGLLGGGVAGLGAKGPTDSMLTRDTQGIPDAQIARARALMEASPVRLTGAEALQQVTGGASGLGTRQRVLEGTSVGREMFNPVMAERPAQVSRAVGQTLDTIAPRTQDPAALGSEIQRLGENRLTEVRRGINAAAEPHYAALENQALSAADMAALQQSPAYRAAQGQLRGNPILNEPYANLPDENLGVVNEVTKQLDQLQAQANPGELNPQGNMTLASRFGEARGLVDDLASAASPDWRLARQIGSEGRTQLLEPLQQGPVGDLARTSDVQQQAATLFPSNPPEGFANIAPEAIAALGPRGADLSRQHLSSAFNEASQNLQSGANQYGGAKFAAQVAGNPAQREVLMANIQQAAPESVSDIENLLQALEATGKRQQPGSQTAYNMEELRSLGDAGVTGNILATGLNPTGTFRRMGEGFKDLSTRVNARRLSEILLSDPAEFERLIMRARSERGYTGPSLGALLSIQEDQNAPR